MDVSNLANVIEVASSNPSGPLLPVKNCFGILGKVCDGTHDYESYDRECCSHEEPCGINQGDCDGDSACQGNLICGTDNCPSPFPSSADCCVNP